MVEEIGIDTICLTALAQKIFNTTTKVKWERSSTKRKCFDTRKKQHFPAKPKPFPREDA